MAIETQCPGCNRRLQVADEHAGKQARCPSCGSIYTVPASGVQRKSTNSAPAIEREETFSGIVSSSDRGEPEKSIRWYMRTPEGQTYGPVDRSELDVWLAEGRITVDCELRDESTQIWQAADHIYGVLRAPAPSARQPSMASSLPSGYSPATARPTTTAAVAPQRFTRPHRAGLVLVLGIVGFVLGTMLPICPICSIMAWVMGTSDLNEMRAGRMDPSGRSMTQAGQILGMIYSVLWILGAVIFVLICLMVAGSA